MSTATPSRPRYDSMKSQNSMPGWPRPPSPSFSTTTTGSRVNVPAAHALITRKDLRQSIACFEDLMAAAKAYRNALLAMSSATAAFATAMEACSRIKGCRSANSALAGAGGLQYLVSNHEQLLADTVYRQFEIPLLEALDHYKIVTTDRLAGYEKSLHEQSARIRKTEAENIKVGKRRKRDLQAFRTALAELQRQVDELDNIKASYHEEVLDGEEEIWETVLGKVAFVVRSQLDFYEKIAGKISDPILEPLVMSIPDPFDSYGPPKEDGQIFSVLAPLGMLDTPGSPNPNLTRSHTSPILTGGTNSPAKSSPFTTSISSPSIAETSTVSAQGQLDSEDDSKDRAKRELSVIREVDAADSNTIIREGTGSGDLFEEDGESAGSPTGKDIPHQDQPSVDSAASASESDGLPDVKHSRQLSGKSSSSTESDEARNITVVE